MRWSRIKNIIILLLVLVNGFLLVSFQVPGGGDGYPSSVEETISASTALARLLDELSRGEGYVCSQILRMYPGYIHSGTSVVTLTPA